jgi:hypothetical protein
MMAITTTISLPDHLSVNTLHTVPIIAPWPSHHARRPPQGHLSGNQRMGRCCIANCWLLTTKRQRIPHRHGGKCCPTRAGAAGQRSRTPDRPTDRPNKGAIMQGRDVCAVRCSSTPDVIWNGRSLCFADAGVNHGNMHILPCRHVWPCSLTFER